MSYYDFSHMGGGDLDYIASHFPLLPQGDLVCAGTFRGGDAMMMRQLLPDRNVVVIDSFRGVSKPGEFDSIPFGEYACSLREYHANFRAAGITPPEEIYPMWIDPRSLEIIPHRPIALLWIDLDQYHPCLSILRYFCNDLVSGSIVLIHDFDSSVCPGIRKAFEIFSEEIGTIYETWRANENCAYIGKIRVRKP